MSSPRLTLLATLSLVLFSASGHLHAGASNKSGNPFGNGTFFQNTGTFSAVVRGQNLSGTMIFSTGANTNTSTNSATGSSSGTTTISYLGGTDSNGATAPAGIYTGNATGTWDPSSGTISGQIWGGYSLSGSNSVNVATYDPITGLTNYGTKYINDASYMSGNFYGSAQNSYPNQTFTAQGTLVQQELAGTSLDLVEITIPISVQGLRIADSYSTFSTLPQSIPYSTTIYTNN
jgi:hypothetical protein